MNKGYKSRDAVSHRITRLAALVKRFNSGTVTFRGRGESKGGGHRAGYKWAESKGIDPHSRIKKYSKNSPSFDEGVWQYKSAHAKHNLAKNIK